MQKYVFSQNFYTQPRKGLWKAFKQELGIFLIIALIAAILGLIADRSADRVQQYREVRQLVNK